MRTQETLSDESMAAVAVGPATLVNVARALSSILVCVAALSAFAVAVRLGWGGRVAMLVGELVGIAVGCGANTPHPDKVTKMSKAWNGFMKRLLSHPLIL